MKRATKYTLFGITGFIIFILLLPLVFYIPAVQRSAVRWAEQWVAEHTDMRISVGNLSLQFPFRLALDEVAVQTATGDTLATARELSTQISVLPLLRGKAVIPDVTLEDARIRYLSGDSSLDLRATAGRLKLSRGMAALSQHTANVGKVSLERADIALWYKDVPDTTARDTTRIDWDISVADINLVDVAYSMYMPPLVDTLQVNVPSASVSQGSVSLAGQKVNVGKVYIDNAAYRYVACDSIEGSSPDSLAVDGSDALPWEIDVSRILLADNQAEYITSAVPKEAGFDVEHIRADKINIDLSSLYNRGGVLRVKINDLTLNERSGLCLTQTQGAFDTDGNGKVRLSDFVLRTPFSDLQADIDADLQIFEGNPAATVDAMLQAHIACRDIVRVYPGAAKFFIHPEASRPERLEFYALSDYEMIKLDAEVEGVGKELSLKKLNVSQPGIFVLESRGVATSLFDERDRRLTARCKVSTTDLVSLENFIPDSALLNRLVMQPIHLDAQASMYGDELQGFVLLDCLGGHADVKGFYNSRKELYEASLGIEQLPMDMFLPQDTIGSLTAHAELSGQHFALDKITTRAEAKVTLDSLDFRRYPYRNVRVMAMLAEQHWSLAIDGSQQEMDVKVDASGIYNKELITANVNAQIGLLDLAGLNLSPEPLDVQGSIAAQMVASKNDSLIQADIVIDKLAVRMGDFRYRAEQINCLAASDVTYSYIDLNTGDLAANLSSDAGLTRLGPSLERLMQFVDTVRYKQRLNMDELHHGLPPFLFTAKAGRNNILQQYLSSKGMQFSSVRLDASNDTLFGLSGIVQRLSVSGMLLDTITVKAHERDGRLNYRLALGNRPGNLDEFAHVQIDGFLSGNSTRLFCTQSNRKDETGFRFGCKADFLDSLVYLTFGPKEPIIGYKTWELNRDNYLSYKYAAREVDADIRLTYGNSHLFLTTDDRRRKSVEGVHVDIQNIELADWLVASPFVTPMSGSISANIFVDLPRQGVEAAGTIDIDDYTYANMRVGSFHTSVDYRLDSIGGNDVKALLWLDNSQVLTLTGYLSNDNPKSVQAALSIDGLPLSVANAFFPPNMGALSGDLNSSLSIGGTLSAPLVDGFIRFDSATTTFRSIGTSLAFDNTEIPIHGSRIYFNDYGIRGANKSPLNINGIVDFSQLSAIGINLDLSARNFEPIHIGESRTAMIYGSAFMDVAARIRGTLDNLSVRGRVSLLSGTNATYVMQDSKLQAGQDYSDMVTFVSFADTVQTYETIASKKSGTGMNMTATVDIDIDQGVQLGINLSADGKNRIDLVGGGNLLYTMSALGDSRFTGRYTLTGGFVRYNPPIISQKLFNIQDGSYVLWNGDIADPTLHIKAVETQRSLVKEGDKGSRPVNFDITIFITNTLSNLGISFDLATTDDLAIQNELQGLTAEQRSSKAINMLLYNSYSDLTSVSSSNMVGNPLNSFLEYELNTWAQKTLKGVDLSFGIDDYGDDGTGTQRTDYSYKFSKSLFDNRLKVVVGGSYATNQDATQNLKENLIDDISLEYRLTKRENMYLKVFRHTGYESIIEGEITQTGVGFLYRKQVMSLLDLFRKKRNEALPYGRMRKATKEQDGVEINDVQSVQDVHIKGQEADNL